MSLLRSLFNYAIIIAIFLFAIQFINNNQIERFEQAVAESSTSTPNVIKRLFAKPIAVDEKNFNILNVVPRSLAAVSKFFIDQQQKDFAPMELVANILAYFTPKPLSPHFQKGGYFFGWNEDFVMTAGAILLLAVIDLLVVRPFMDPGARYYALHAVANAIATVAAAPDVFRAFFVDPATAFSGASHTMMANSAIAAIHIYHCIAFQLSAADIFHHMTFVVTLCGMAIPGKNYGGVANNLGCFFREDP